MSARKSTILVLLIFVIVVLSGSISETKGTLTSLSVTLVNPSNQSTVTGTPVSLQVLFQNTTTGRNCAGLTTDFLMYYSSSGSTPPVTSDYKSVGTATSGSDGQATLSYNPPFAGTYYWYINVYLKAPKSGQSWSVLKQPANWTNLNSNGGPWSFTTSALSTYTTALSTSLIYSWSSTAYTETVPAETDYSYLYQSMTLYQTQYTTQTASFTTTQNYYATSISTYTVGLSTLTAPVTMFEMTTQSQTVLQSMTITRYIYLDSSSGGANVNAVSQNPSGQLEARLSETVGSNLPPIVAVAGAGFFCFTMLYRWRHKAKSGTGDAE